MALLDELPPPPPGRTGWPWSEESENIPETMSDGFPWPKISIVTPSFNQGEFIEETIRSVLLQNYPEIEYIVIDGGSTDDSVEIIKKYARWLTYWVSEPDEGQSHAINKGMSRAGGVLVNWLNSDDVLAKGALRAVAEAYRKSRRAVAWCGGCHFMQRDGLVYLAAAPVPGGKAQLANWGGWDSEAGAQAWLPQPSCYFRRQTFLDVGGISNELHFTMDVELWMKLVEVGKIEVFPEVISSARIYDEIKTRQDYPARMVEHVVINWNLGEKIQARNKILQFGNRYARQYLLSMGARNLAWLILTWIYRKLVGNPLKALGMKIPPVVSRGSRH